MAGARKSPQPSPAHLWRWVLVIGAACLLGPARADDAAAAATSARSTVATTTALSPEQVRMVQRTLAEKGYDVPVTSTWDDGTRSALTKFQRSRDLPATGELDPATTQALGFDPALAMPVRGTASPAEPTGPYDRYDVHDPDVNCGVNNTVDCRYGSGG